MQQFTPEDLLCYLYKEMTPEGMAAVEAELSRDWTLREKLAVLKSAQERLNQVVESPRTELILNVLKYAAATTPREAVTRS